MSAASSCAAATFGRRARTRALGTAHHAGRASVERQASRPGRRGCRRGDSPAVQAKWSGRRRIRTRARVPVAVNAASAWQSAVMSRPVAAAVRDARARTSLRDAEHHRHRAGTALLSSGSTSRLLLLYIIVRRLLSPSVQAHWQRMHDVEPQQSLYRHHRSPGCRPVGGRCRST